MSLKWSSKELAERVLIKVANLSPVMQRSEMLSLGPPSVSSDFNEE